MNTKKIKPINTKLKQEQKMIVKPTFFLGSSLDDLAEMPQEVKTELGNNLFLAQCGEHPPIAKPLTGIGSGANVVELIDDFRGDTYRAVYTIKFNDIIYVLHCFQKKSKSGVATPKKDIDIIKARLKLAVEIELQKAKLNKLEKKK